MKKHLLILSFMLSITIQARSQSLTNTFWIAYDSTNVANLYFHFGSDTLSYSNDNINYMPLSVYSQAASIITFVDINTVFCTTTDAGIYSVSIEADTLRFHIVSDLCSSRSRYLLNNCFLQILTGINSQDAFEFSSPFPNPLKENLSFNIKNNKPAEFILYNSNMQKVISKTISNRNSAVNTSSLSSGIYFYTLRYKDGLLTTGKLVKQ